VAENPIRTDQVEERIRDRVLLVDPEPYKQGRQAPKFRESDQPFSVEAEGKGVAHLLFSADAVESPNTFRARDDPGGIAHLATRIELRVGYRLRQNRRRADTRLAQRCAHAIVQAINAHWPDGTPMLVDAWRPRLLSDGSYLEFMIIWDIEHDYPT
jgi:hypothetical protein